jgi:hypothetical protein
MELTVKAILARFGGDIAQAEAYCKQIAEGTSNPHLGVEYQKLWFQFRMRGSAAHA